MNKAKINHFLKMLLVMLLFIVAYAASSVITTWLLGYSFNDYFSIATLPVAVSTILIILLCCLTNLHVSAYRHASISEILKIGIISLITLCVNVILGIALEDVHGAWCIITSLFFFVISAFIIFSYRILSFFRSRSKRMLHHEKRVLIVGAGQAGATILREIQTSDKICYHVVGFVDSDPAKIGSVILGVKVLGPIENIKEYVNDKAVDLIIIAIPSANAQTIKRISKYCIETKCETKISPGLYQLIDGELSVSRLRDVDVQDLLGREPVSFNLDEVMGYIQDQVVLVTGGWGSIGS